MKETDFWRLISEAKKIANNQYERPKALYSLLNEYEPKYLEKFSEIYREKLNEAYSWPLWGAAYIINGGCSDDCFDYFRDWLISEGQDIYEKALENPESLADLPAIEEAELEDFRYVVDEVYENKMGQSMALRVISQPTEPSGDEWDEDSVYSLYPALAEMY